LSPLSPLWRLVAEAGTQPERQHLGASIGLERDSNVFPAIDGDRSPAESADKSAHSKVCGCVVAAPILPLLELSLRLLGVPMLFLALTTSPMFGTEAPQPFLLDLRAFESEAGSLHVSNALAAPIVLITDKPQPSPSGDPHDYISYGRYWWPDQASSNGLPFIRQDGHANREQLALGDRSKMGDLTTAVPLLAVAWHRERCTNCAVRAGEWLRAWFVSPATRMNPSLDYAQVRMGHDENLGSNFGLIDTRGLAEVVDSIRLLQGSPALTAKDGEVIRQWFTDYLRWLLTSKNGRLEREAPNNHGTWYLVQAIAIARFLGNEEQARELAREDFDRIGWQFEPDGSQPLEMERTDGLSYCQFNLEAQFKVATLAEPLGEDLWHYTATNGASLRKGLEFLRPYNSAPETWPHQQMKQLQPGFLQSLLHLAENIWPENGTNPSSQK
jgi:hypothetical protein